jgi:hypothetical protein
VGLVNANLVNRIKGLPDAKIVVESGDYGSFNRNGNAVKISIGSLSANDQSQLSGILKDAFAAIAEALGEYYLDYNVKVINETGGQFRDGLIGDVTTAMSYLDTADYVNAGLSMNEVSSRHAEIIITNGTEGGDGEAFDGDTIKMGKSYLSTYNQVEVMLEGNFYDMLQMPDPKATSMNRSNSIIRLVNGRTITTDQIIKFGRQFSTAKQVGNAEVPGTKFA